VLIIVFRAKFGGSNNNMFPSQKYFTQGCDVWIVSCYLDIFSLAAVVIAIIILR